MSSPRPRRASVPTSARVRVDIAVGGNLEARARDARYAALEAVAPSSTPPRSCVGHTRDDQAETVLLNLLRGSATSGLAGMPRPARPPAAAAARVPPGRDP